MKKRILSLIASIVLILVAVIGLQNEKVVDAADEVVLLEKRHPGYWEYLRNNAREFDTNGDNKDDVTVYMLSKTFLGSIITRKDYQIFTRDSSRVRERRFIYFYDGTGIDISTSEYGKANTDSWSVTNGVSLNDIIKIDRKDKAINEITDIYEYLTALKNYSFIISVKDDAEGGWNNSLQRLLESYGLKGGFNYRDSYIAVVNKGQVVNEQISHNILEFTYNNLYIKSAGYDTGMATSVISINGIDYSVKGRGLNIVVLDNNYVMDSVAFDTFDALLTAKRIQH